MSGTTPFHLFDVYGVELEYMIVDADTLDVRPITDRVLYEIVGEYLSEIELGDIAWSNELALHVIELKTNGPAPSLAPLALLFQSHVRRINGLLESLGARLMPTAMHPWMDPDLELKLWPHQYNPIYEAYNRIFDCRGHGWANLQSVHLNLPFAGDEEFGRLHAAIRLLLPILPAMAASSPVVDGQLTGLADYRMEVYRNNSQRVPSITADVIPEPAFTRTDYEQRIFERIYNDIAPSDPAGVLRHEWLNARGAIARFDRSTIEIRVLDVQECPAADLAICQTIVAVLRALTEEHWSSVAEQQSFTVQPLATIFLQAIRDAEQTMIDDDAYLAQFGVKAAPISARDLWVHLVKASCKRDQARTVDASTGVQQQTSLADPTNHALETILREGPLSRRIQRALDGDVSRLAGIYRTLCDCLAEGRMFS